MKIVIKGTRVFSSSNRWMSMMDKVRGKTLRVETEYLFDNQFNTVPIRGVSENGLRIMETDVKRVIDDERIGRSRCQWCGKHFKSGVLFCPHCGKDEYIHPFIRSTRCSTDKRSTGSFSTARSSGSSKTRSP